MDVSSLCWTFLLGHVYRYVLLYVLDILQILLEGLLELLKHQKQKHEVTLSLFRKVFDCLSEKMVLTNVVTFLMLIKKNICQ